MTDRSKTIKRISVPMVIVGVVMCFCVAIFGGDKDRDSKDSTTTKPSVTAEQQVKSYTFRTQKSLDDHFRKHGADTYSKSAEEYLEKANAVINNPDALKKIESDEGDGDRVFYIEDTDEIVFLSEDNYIRTYFICSGKDYFDRQ